MADVVYGGLVRFMETMRMCHISSFRKEMKVGRRKGSKNRPKDTSACGELPPAGHNGCPLIDDEYRALLFQPGGHLERYKDALASKKNADAHLKDVCKIARSELGPNAVKDIKLAIEAETPEGEESIKSRLESQLRVLRWIGLPVGHQGALFASVDLTPAVDKARADGNRAGFRGERCSPPYDPSVPQYSSWMDGWRAGQDILVSTPEESASHRRKEYAADEQLGTEEPSYVES